MTLAFIFPIKDAWIVVADRLVTITDGLVMEDGKEHRIPIDNKSKIEELSKELIFIGAGDLELLDEFVKLINSKNNLDEFNQEFNQYCTSLSVTPFATSVKKTEFIIIDKSNLTATKYLDGHLNNISDSLDNSFIGSKEALSDFSVRSAKTKLIREKGMRKLSKNKNNFLISILEDLSSQRLDCIGHPAIDGCDIWEIKKDKIRKFFIEPKKYSWRILP